MGDKLTIIPAYGVGWHHWGGEPMLNVTVLYRHGSETFAFPYTFTRPGWEAPNRDEILEYEALARIEDRA